MTCGGCSGAVRLALKEMEGVTDVKVSHEDNIATVAYDPNKVTAKQIVKVIEKAGFKAKLEKTDGKDA
jgi:Cu+-exporting ATPase